MLIWWARMIVETAPPYERFLPESRGLKIKGKNSLFIIWYDKV